MCVHAPSQDLSLFLKSTYILAVILVKIEYMNNNETVAPFLHPDIIWINLHEAN